MSVRSRFGLAAALAALVAGAAPSASVAVTTRERAGLRRVLRAHRHRGGVRAALQRADGLRTAEHPDTSVRARACSVHLDTDSAKRQAQLDDVAYVVNTPGCVGHAGDRCRRLQRHARPPRGARRPLHRGRDHINKEWTHESRSCPYATDAAARGQYCQGRYTRKIDHIFYGRNHIVSFSVSGAPAGTCYSDHLPAAGHGGLQLRAG